MSTGFAEGSNRQNGYYPLAPPDLGDSRNGRRPAPATYAERESARGDQIVDMVKNNEVFTHLPLQEQQRGPAMVQALFSAHLTGHVQARLMAGGRHASEFYDTIVKPKMWEFTAQHFKPVLRRRVRELRENLPYETPDGAAVIKNLVKEQLPTFEAHDRAMQYAVDEEVRAARLAAIAAHDPHPELAAQRKLQQVTEWRLTRAEYDSMVDFVDRTVDDVLTRDASENMAEDLFHHLHMP